MEPPQGQNPEKHMCGSTGALPAGEDGFLVAAHGFHEDLVIEAGEFLHSSQQFNIPCSTLGNAAAGGSGGNEQPETVWGKGPVAVGEDVDPFEFVPADCLDNPIGAVAGDFRFSDVDDVLAFGVQLCTRGIRRPSQNPLHHTITHPRYQNALAEMHHSVEQDSQD